MLLHSSPFLREAETNRALEENDFSRMALHVFMSHRARLLPARAAASSLGRALPVGIKAFVGNAAFIGQSIIGISIPHLSGVL